MNIYYMLAYLHPSLFFFFFFYFERLLFNKLMQPCLFMLKPCSALGVNLSVI